MVFNLVPSPLSTRQWLSLNPKTYNAYMFSITQARDAAGTWSPYIATWSSTFIWGVLQVYGSRPGIPNSVDGNPFIEYADAVAACEAILDTLP